MVHDLEKILADGVHAPSGENCQPWRFEIFESTVSVYDVPEVDMSLYNSNKTSSYIAHGALLETIRISATYHGYETIIVFPPNTEDETHIADIIFKKTDSSVDGLYTMIFNRCTNRKYYKNIALSDEQKKSLAAVVEENTNLSIKFVDGASMLEKVGTALSAYEYLLFSNTLLHNFFYSHILWKHSDEHKRGGFYYKTLEFTLFQTWIIKMCSIQWVLLLFNHIFQLPYIVYFVSKKKYLSSGSIGCIAMNIFNKEECVKAGMSIQRMWLKATSFDLSLQPSNGIIYLYENILSKETNFFSNGEVKLLQKAYNQLVQSFKTGDKKQVFIFRIGTANHPTSHAKRLPPNIQYRTS